jgi:hypothetical protein
MGIVRPALSGDSLRPLSWVAGFPAESVKTAAPALEFIVSNSATMASRP